MSDRLDRLEALAENNTLAIQALSEQTAINERLTADNANAIKVLTEHQAQYSEQLRSEVTNLAELIHVLSQQHGETIARIDVMQSEVRGLQVETRRILERWDNNDN
jgi:tRNA A37 methylthiotransferase MiaB